MADCHGAPQMRIAKKGWSRNGCYSVQRGRLGALWYSIHIFLHTAYSHKSYTLYIQETYRPPSPVKRTVNAKSITSILICTRPAPVLLPMANPLLGISLVSRRYICRKCMVQSPRCSDWCSAAAWLLAEGDEFIDDECIQGLQGLIPFFY